jgi:hypothetical protein
MKSIDLMLMPKKRILYQEQYPISDFIYNAVQVEIGKKIHTTVHIIKRDFFFHEDK